MNTRHPIAIIMNPTTTNTFCKLLKDLAQISLILFPLRSNFIKCKHILLDSGWYANTLYSPPKIRLQNLLYYPQYSTVVSAAGVCRLINIFIAVCLLLDIFYTTVHLPLSIIVCSCLLVSAFTVSCLSAVLYILLSVG